MRPNRGCCLDPPHMGRARVMTVPRLVFFMPCNLYLCPPPRRPPAVKDNTKDFADKGRAQVPDDSMAAPKAANISIMMDGDGDQVRDRCRPACLAACSSTSVLNRVTGYFRLVWTR